MANDFSSKNFNMLVRMQSMLETIQKKVIDMEYRLQNIEKQMNTLKK